MTTVSRHARLIDLSAIVFIVAGGLLFLEGGSRMTEIGKLSYRHPGPRSESALEAADRARYMAHGGLLLVIVGCGVGAVGAVWHARVKRRRIAV